MSKIKFLALLLSLLLAAAPALAEEPTKAAAPEANYETAAVTRGAFIRTAQNVGTLFFPLTANIKYEGQQGIFQDYTVRRGDYVEAGQVIATVLVEGSDVSHSSAQLALQRTQEAYVQGCQDYEAGIQQAYAALSSMTDSYEQEMQRLRIRQLESQYALYRFQQEHSIAQQKEDLGELVPDNTIVEIKAPISGIVEDLLSMRTETIVGDGWVLGSIYSLNTVLLTVPNESGSFRYGMDVEVSTGGSKNPTYYSGRVIASDNVLPQSQRDHVAYIAVEYDPETINPAALKNISVRAESIRVDGALLLPRSSVIMENGKNYVTLYEDGVLKKRYVLAGDSNTDMTWILGGLTEGEQVILD